MRIFPETYAVGAQFGVVLVPSPQPDVASNVSTDGRHVTCYVSPVSQRHRIQRRPPSGPGSL
jgi:hypothetical protein